MKMHFSRKILLLFLSLMLALSMLSVGWASEATVEPPVPSVGCFVDNYTKNIEANLTSSSNPCVFLVSGFSELWTPGAAWNSGIKLNSTVLDANIQKCIELTTKRTANEETQAYFDDRREQSYSTIDGLGSLTDVYRTNAGATTTINDIPADATTKKYDDKGTGSGDESSSLGNIVKLVNTLRGSYSSANPTKNSYQYMRPYRWSNSVVVVPTLVPAKNPVPDHDGGFPSGHTNASYLTAIAMAYAVPERYQELLTRASELGNDRIIAGMHSPLDVMGGRTIATALAAAILSDPANKTLKRNAFNDAHNKLLTQIGTSIDRFSNYAVNKKNYTQRLTYGFTQINSTNKPMVVPKGAEVLLETRLPYLNDTQRRWVLYTTGLPSGYPLLDDVEGWGRLNLFAAADGYGAFVNDVSVTMDASQGGFNAMDYWRNDIAGTGKLTKKGTGTLKLAGNNIYSGGTQIDQGTLEGNSTTAFGSSDVMLTGGTLIKNVSGKLTIGGKYTQAANGTLELNLGSKEDKLCINGAAAFGGKLRLKFLNHYIPDNGSMIITCGKRARSGVFSTIETVGLSSEYNVNVSYTANGVQLQVTKH